VVTSTNGFDPYQSTTSAGPNNEGWGGCRVGSGRLRGDTSLHSGRRCLWSNPDRVL